MTLQELQKPCPGDFCLLCGGKPQVIGMFVPEEPEIFGGIEGKKRFFRYCLCSKCKSKSDTPEKVEKVIASELAGEKVNHAS